MYKTASNGFGLRSPDGRVLLMDPNAPTTNPDMGQFGGAVVHQLRPEIQLKFTGGRLDNQVCEHFESGAASEVVWDNYRARLTNDTGVGDYAVLRSKQYLPYQPGNGAVGRFTTVFPSPDAELWAMAGMANTGDGFLFGYQGGSDAMADFGIIHRRGGSPCIVEFVRAAGAATNANLTFNLPNAAGGLTACAITVTTTSSTAQTVVSEAAIALNNLAAFNAIYNAESAGTVLRCIAKSSGACSATPTVTGVDSAQWTPEKKMTGAANGYTVVKTGSWNGAEAASIIANCNWQQGNVFQISFQWLGMGVIRFWVEDPDTGRLALVHTIEYPSTATAPSIYNPNTNLEFSVYNVGVGGTGVGTMYVTSGAAFSESIASGVGPKLSFVSEKTAGGSSEEHMLTVRNCWIDGTKTGGELDVGSAVSNYGVFVVEAVVVASEYTKLAVFRFYANASPPWTSVTDYPQWMDTADSCMQYDTTAVTAPTGGSVLSSTAVSAGSQYFDLTALNVRVPKGGTFSVTCQSANTTDNFVSVYGRMEP